MFNAEADVLAHLSAHPAIVTVYQAGISADGRPYIVMEYCPGSLAQRYRIERIPVDEVLAVGVRMASALESAHRAGLVHRDVKPSNILITTFGTPVLADFGISSSLQRATADEVLAMSIPWSAPEVVAEQTAGHRRERGVEPRGDRVFAARRAQPVRTAASAGRTPRSSCAAASRGRATPSSRAPMCRHPCRRPRDRDEPRPGAATRQRPEFAEELRAVQARARPLADAARDRRPTSGPAHPGSRLRRHGAARTSRSHRARRSRPQARRPTRHRGSPATRTPSSRPAGRRAPRRTRRGSSRGLGRASVTAVGDRPAVLRRPGCSDAAPHAVVAAGRGLAAVAVVVGVSVVWPGLDAQETARRRHLGVGAADRRRPTLRAREHHRRRTRHRSQRQQPRQGDRPGRRRRLPLQRQPQQGHEDRRGAAGRPRR